MALVFRTVRGRIGDVDGTEPSASPRRASTFSERVEAELTRTHTEISPAAPVDPNEGANHVDGPALDEHEKLFIDQLAERTKVQKEKHRA